VRVYCDKEIGSQSESLRMKGLNLAEGGSKESTPRRGLLLRGPEEGPEEFEISENVPNSTWRVSAEMHICNIYKFTQIAK